MESGAGGATSEANGTRRSGSFELDLLFLFLLVVAFNLPQLQQRVVPINDTFYLFSNFHVFYSELFFHGDLARWFPYSSYGIPSDYEQIIALSPANYLFGAIGWLFRVPDALLLFKLAAVFEQCVFVFGVFLASRRLFPSRVTALILGVAAAGTTVWYAQQWWNLRIYYLLPLLLYFWFSFLETRRPALFWLAGLTGVAWSIGNLSYLVPVWALALLVIAAVSTRDLRATLASLATPSRSNLIAFALFALAAAGYASFVLRAFEGTIVHAASRDPVSGEVGAEVFLGYGGKANLVVVLNALLFGWPVHLPWGSRTDNSVYIGLVPIAGLALALVRERSRNFLALVAAALVVVWLSFGGLFAALVFHLPGFSYYRHIGLVFGIVKVLLLLASGYGVERVLRSAPPRFANPVLLGVVAALFIETLAALPRLPELTPKGWNIAWGDQVLVRLAVYALLIAACRATQWRRLGVALVVGMIVDLALFQYAVLDQIPAVPRAEAPLLAATRVREPFYQPERREHATGAAGATADGEGERAFALATRPVMKETYAYVYPFANFDPCREEFRSDTHLIGVDRLLALGRTPGVSIDGVVGCRTPKLRLATRARVARSDEEARAALRDSLALGEPLPLVIEIPAGDVPPDTAEASPGGVVVADFALGELVAKVDVAAPNGAWLVYADAYHPDWRASVNGTETAIRRANLAFKAVRVPHGTSEVRLWFDPAASGVLGPAIAAGGAAGALAMMLWMGIRSVRGPRVTARN